MINKHVLLIVEMIKLLLHHDKDSKCKESPSDMALNYIAYLI